MALFGKKKNADEVKNNQTEESKASSTLDLIKETIEEEKLEKQAAANQQMQNDFAEVSGGNAPINANNIVAVSERFAKDKSQENLNLVMECLRNPQTMVCIPAQLITSKENEEKMKQGGQVKLEGPIKINPLILTDDKGVKVFPVFSSEKAIPDEIKKQGQKVNIPFAQCMKMLTNINEVNTFVLDPYTANIRIQISENKPN